jgi:hypothetical protein
MTRELDGMSQTTDGASQADQEGPQGGTAKPGAAGGDFEFDEAWAGAAAGRTDRHPKEHEAPAFEDPNDR